MMHPIDYSIIVLYLLLLLFFGFIYRLKKEDNVSDLILGGRVLTLPAFIASLVSTWYGGILGVGEYTYLYGISNWLVFGLPYYLAALLFAVFLAKKARQSKLLTIPERLAQTYDNKTALAGSIIIFLMTVPAAYILMLGVLCEQFFNLPFSVGVILGTIFSIIYLFMGGFKAVVRTDLFQFVLMFIGFIVLLGYVSINYGGFEFLRQNIPNQHFSWHGGNSGWYIAVWYVIALATLIEPAFFQRCYAAKNEKTARNGIFISIICWVFFDFLTTTTGLYAKAILPNLTDPVASFPALAMEVLPIGLVGLFALALLSTIMSTVDSYSFLAASTFGNDIIPKLFKNSSNKIIFYTRIGLVFSTILAVVFALFFRSAVDIWHAFGSIGTPALLIPLFFSFVGEKRMPPKAAFFSIVFAGSLSLVWYCSKYFIESGEYFLQIQPIFPGLIISLLIFILSRKNRNLQL